MGVLLGIDKGTFVVKSVVFSIDGRELASAQRRIVVLRPEPDRHEEDPRKTWALCAETIREALAEAGVGGADVLAIGVAAHMGGVWLVDAAGEPVRNAICWPDARAQADLVALERSGAAERIFALSGNGLMPGITALLLGWLSRNEPETLNRARTFVAKYNEWFGLYQELRDVYRQFLSHGAALTMPLPVLVDRSAA